MNYVFILSFHLKEALWATLLKNIVNDGLIIKLPYKLNIENKIIRSVFTLHDEVPVRNDFVRVCICCCYMPDQGVTGQHFIFWLAKFRRQKRKALQYKWYLCIVLTWFIITQWSSPAEDRAGVGPWKKSRSQSRWRLERRGNYQEDCTA